MEVVPTKALDKMNDSELREDFFKEMRKMKADLLKEMEVAKKIAERTEAECADKFSDKFLKTVKAWPKKLGKLRDTVTEITREAEQVKAGPLFKGEGRFRKFLTNATAECFEWNKMKKELRRDLGKA